MLKSDLDDQQTHLRQHFQLIKYCNMQHLALPWLGSEPWPFFLSSHSSVQPQSRSLSYSNSDFNFFSKSADTISFFAKSGPYFTKPFMVVINAAV
jgi:hypothetical protein